MAERDRPTSARGDATEGFLHRWSRRKAEARSTPAPTEDSSDPGEHAPASRPQAPAPEQDAPAPIDPKDLPDIASLDASSDFTAFMRPGVPEHLRTLALRKLWRSDPIFSKLDGLVEYGEDYSIPSWPKGTIKTAYQIGRGFVNELEKLGAAEAQPATPPEPVTGPVTGPVAAPGPVASAGRRSPADAAEDPPQPVPEQPGPASTGSDAPRSADASGPAKRQPRPLPRRG